MTKLYEPSIPKLMEAMAAEAQGLKGMDRRNFLKGGIAAVAGLSSVSMIPKANASSNLPPNLPEWQSLWVQVWCQSPMAYRLDSRIYNDVLFRG